MKLIFVYNAKSGIGNKMLDAMHKTLSPNTYECDLCSLTYGNVGPKKDWQEFLKSINMDTEFHYKDKFASAHPLLKDEFPVIYAKNGDYQLLVSSQEMTQCNDLSQLIDKIKSNLSTVR